MEEAATGIGELVAATRKRAQRECESGCRVQITGLQAKPELNGREGTLLNFMADTGRWGVVLSGGNKLSVKPDNLELLAYECIVAPTRSMMPASLVLNRYAVLDEFLPREDLANFCNMMRDELRSTLAEGDVAGGKAEGLYARITKQAAPRGDLMRFLDTDDMTKHPPLGTALDAIDGLVLRELLVADELHTEWKGRSLRREEMQATCYPAGGARYVRHVDNNTSRPKKHNSGGAEAEAKEEEDERPRTGRRITCILYANQEWKPGDGGELRLHPEASASVDVAPRANRLVIFYSDERVPHEVLPAHAERFALSIWYHDHLVLGPRREDEKAPVSVT